MKTSVRSAAIALVAVLAMATSARADSDGYYCLGPGYLAFQLRGWNTDGPHLLKVVRFSGGQAELAGQVELPDFQPHEMTCAANRIRMAGWGSEYVEYTVELGPEKEPSAAQLTAQRRTAVAELRADPLPNLGEWAYPGVVPIRSDERDHVYALVIGVEERPVAGGIEHHVRTFLVSFGSDAAEEARLLLYEGMRLETVH